MMSRQCAGCVLVRLDFPGSRWGSLTNVKLKNVVRIHERSSATGMVVVVVVIQRLANQVLSFNVSFFG